MRWWFYNQCLACYWLRHHSWVGKVFHRGRTQLTASGWNSSFKSFNSLFVPARSLWKMSLPWRRNIRCPRRPRFHGFAVTLKIAWLIVIVSIFVTSSLSSHLQLQELFPMNREHKECRRCQVCLYRSPTLCIGGAVRPNDLRSLQEWWEVFLLSSSSASYL